MRLAIVCKLSDSKLRSKIAPLLAMDTVEEIALIRKTPINEFKIHNYCPSKWLRKISPLVEVWRIFIVFRICLSSSPPDYLIAFYMIPHGIYIGIAGWLCKIKTIQVSLSSKDSGFVKTSNLIYYIYKKAFKIGVRGENSLRVLVDGGIRANSIFIPPNVFNVDDFVINKIQKPEFDLIYLGDKVSEKRLDILLKAISNIKQVIPNIRLALVGGGILGKELENLAIELQIEENVFFINPVKYKDVPYYLAKARIFIMTSEYEGLPMAMIEALTCGLPVIMPDVGDVTTIAHHKENAWIVYPPNAENYSKAIQTLLKDHDLYVQLQAGAMYSRELFRIDYSLKRAMEVWKEALENPKKH